MTLKYSFSKKKYNEFEFEKIYVNYFLYEYFINNKQNNIKQKNNLLNKTFNNLNNYKNTVKLNSVNTILIENNDIILNLFTNKEGYILNHFHSNNLNKFYIIESFLKSIKKYLKLKLSTNNIFIKSKNLKILNDFDKILNLIEQYIPIEKIFNNEEFKYLYECYNIYFILIVYNDNKRIFKNIIELYKIIKNSNNTFNNIKLIQNLIFIERHDNNKNIIFDLNKESIQPLIISYFNNNKKKFIKLYLGNNFPLTINFNIFKIEKSLSDLNNNKINVDKNNKNLNYSRNDNNNLVFQKSKSSKSLSHLSKNNNKNNISNQSNDDLNYNVFNEEMLKYYINKNFITLLVNKNFLYDYFKEKIFSFISFIENNAKIKINYCLFNFVKDFLNKQYFFIGGYNLIANKNENEKTLFQCKSARLLNNNNNNIENKKSFKCFGEFCNYIIPNNIKELEFKIKTNDFLLKNILNNNYIKNYSIPIFILKKVNDNPQIVNLILKCYNIFPKNINKEKMFNDIIKEKEIIFNHKNFLSKNFNKIKSLNIPLFSDLDEIKNNFDNVKNEDEIILYKPKKLFEINIQKIYNNLPICYNCYIVYKLIEKYIKELEKKLFHNKNLFDNNINNNYDKILNNIIKQSENYQINSYDNIKYKNNLLFYDKFKEQNFLFNLVKNLNKKKKKFLDNNRKCFSYTKIYKHNNYIKLFNKNNLNYSVFNNSLNNSQLFNIKIKENKNQNKFLNVTFNKQRNSNNNKDNKNSVLMYKRMYLGYPAKIYYNNNNNFNENISDNINIINDNINNKNQNNYHITNNRHKLHHNIDIDIFFNMKELKNSNKQTFSEMTENRIFNFIKSRTDEELIEKNNFVNKIFNEDVKNNANKNIPKTSQIGLKKKEEEEESILSLSNDFKLEEEEEIKDNTNKKINYYNNNINNINDFKSNKKNLLIKKHEDLLNKINKGKNEKNNFKNKNNDLNLDDIIEINDSEESIFNHQIKQNKKNNVHLFSIFYKKNYKETNEFYYITSPLIKLKDGIPIYEKNPLIKYNNLITSKDYSIITNFPYTNFLMNSEIYIYNNYTAIPYKILTYQNKENLNTKNKLVVFILNDFFDTYEKYYYFFKKLFDKLYKNNKLNNFLFLKIIFFNLPGQAYTLWAHKDILNNIYYANFLDKFIFYLYNIKKIFDINTHISFFGFGFGGHIILTYINLYKNFNINFNLILLFNSYLYVDNFLSKNLNEIKQYVIKKKDIYFIKNFKKIIYNKFVEDKNINSEDNNNIDNKVVLEEDELKLNGVLSIINGINYNININNKLNINNIKTPIIFLNSLDNNFIKFKNIENILLNIEQNRSYILIENFGKNKYLNLSDLYIDNNNDIYELNNYYKLKNNNKNFSNIKIITIKGPHELISNNNKEYVINLVNSYIYTYNVLNN